MACDHCCPDRYDYGWELPDTRSEYIVWGPVQHYEDCPDHEDCDCDYREVDTRITIRIRRDWHECECGMGSDYSCRFAVSVNERQECSFDSEFKAETYISIAYPEAELDYDPDWESERRLRQAEGWG
jgi:hypothetical protein